MERSNPCDTEADRLTLLRMALDDWPLPLASEVNPLADHAARRQQSWFSTHALADVGDPEDPLMLLQAPRVAALAYPRAALSTLSLATDWTAWFFHFDDYFDEGPMGKAEHRARQTVDFIRHALGHRPSDGVPRSSGSLHRTQEAFADLMARSREIMTGWQSRMFVFHLESYFEALVTEAVNREHDAIPDVKSYCALRRNTGPALPLLDLVEHTEGIRLPRSFHGSALFGRLMEAAADVAGWINDVFSVSKEQDRGDFHNLVLVIQHAEEINIVEAGRLAINKIGERLRLLDGATQAVDEWCLSAGVPQAERLALHSWVRGLHDFQHHANWYIDHARYATSQYPGGSSRSPLAEPLLSSTPILR
jgi:hypothetical protein